MLKFSGVFVFMIDENIFAFSCIITTQHY